MHSGTQGVFEADTHSAGWMVTWARDKSRTFICGAGGAKGQCTALGGASPSEAFE